MADFTPGPWKASTAGPLGESTITGGGGLSGFIAQVQGQANADLIAAAPDMFAALLKVREYGLHDGPPYEAAKVYDLIDAALAKAEGKSNAQ